MRFSALLMLSIIAAGAVAAPAQDADVYRAKCGVCHLEGGTGTFMLGRRLGKSNALLEKRVDLNAAYVRHVVRHGIQSMPAMTRAELSDAELHAVVSYLTRARPESKE